MNAHLRILLSGGSAQDTTTTTIPLWSVVYAAATTGDDIVVDAPVTMDVAQTPIYGCIEVTSSGKIIRSRLLDTELRFDCMEVTGEDFIGSVSDPWPLSNTYTPKTTPSGARSLDPNVIAGTALSAAVPTSNRGIMWMPGSIRNWVCEVPAVTITRLAATAAVGATSLTLEDAVTWKAGWEFELTTSKYPSEGVGREVCVVASDVTNSTTVPIVTPLTYRHYGALQYAVPEGHASEGIAGTGLSLTPRNFVSGDTFGYMDLAHTIPFTGTRVLASLGGMEPGKTQIVIDNRAAVGLLTYKHKYMLASATDADWMAHGYGVTDMTMGLSSQSMMQGTEMRRMGKAGQLGAYPIHHHMRSMTPYGQVGSGTALGSVTAATNFLRKCSIRDSTNRAVTIHGTDGFEVSDCTILNCDTHNIFTEDGSEIDNTFHHNLISQWNVINTVGQAAATAGGGTYVPKTVIKTFDELVTSDLSTGPAAIWISHADNTITDNIIRGGPGSYIGQWNAFTKPYHTGGAVTATGAGGGYMLFDFVPKFGAGEGVPETITLTCTNATVPATFQRVGSVSGLMSPVTAGVEATSGIAYLGDGKGVFRYYVIASGAAFQVGDVRRFPVMLRQGPMGQSRDSSRCGWTSVPRDFSRNDIGCVEYTCMLTSPGAGNEAGAIQTPHSNGGYQWGNANNDTFANAAAPLREFNDYNLWKGERGSYYHTLIRPYYRRFRASAGRENYAILHDQPLMFMGNTEGGSFDGLMAFPKTLDDAYPSEHPTVMLSYGNSMGRKNCYVQMQPLSNFRRVNEGVTVHAGGMMTPWDFYTYPTYELRDFGTLDLNNSFVGGGTPGTIGMRFPPHFLLTQFGASYTAIYDPVGGGPGNTGTKGDAGAFKLPADGSMFGVAGGWWVFDSPFLLYGTSGSVYAPSGTAYPNLNGKILSSAHNFYGIKVNVANHADATVLAHNFRRMQTDGVTAVTGGTWNTPAPVALHPYPNMRHAAVPHGGIIECDIPSLGPLSQVDAVVTGMGVDYSPSNANYTIKFKWNPSTAVSSCQLRSNVGTHTLNVEYHTFTDAGSLANVIAATTCKYWKDTANSWLYVHIFGGDLTGPHPLIHGQMNLTIN